MSDKVLKQLDNEARTIFNYNNHRFSIWDNDTCRRPAEQDPQNRDGGHP